MRKDREKNGGSFPAVTGASSLLVIFSVLCLTVFAMLSMSTVTSKHRIAERNTQALQAYYAAEEDANRVLADLRTGKQPQGVKRSVAEVPGFGTRQVYEYSCYISDTKSLEVSVWISSDPDYPAEYRILRWQEVSGFDWEADDHIPVYNGN